MARELAVVSGSGGGAVGQFGVEIWWPKGVFPRWRR
jgi:hypothetical protein